MITAIYDDRPLYRLYRTLRIMTNCPMILSKGSRIRLSRYSLRQSRERRVHFPATKARDAGSRTYEFRVMRVYRARLLLILRIHLSIPSPSSSSSSFLHIIRHQPTNPPAAHDTRRQRRATRSTSRRYTRSPCQCSAAPSGAYPTASSIPRPSGKHPPQRRRKQRMEEMRCWKERMDGMGK